MNQDSADRDVEFDRSSPHEIEGADRAGMMLRVKNRLRRHEGWVNHMYLDTKGNVTVGVGFLLPRSSEVGFYSWRTKDRSKGSVPLAYAKVEWNTVNRLPYGQGIKASTFDKKTTIELSDATIGSVLTKKLATLRDDLRRVFALDSEDDEGNIIARGVDFDELPTTVQEAMLDLGWNVKGFQEANVFPKMKIAIKRGDWRTAAVESHRATPIPETRNAEIYELIESAGHKR